MENFGYGDWLANNKDACYPTPKAAHIMAEKIWMNLLKLLTAQMRNEENVFNGKTKAVV